MTGTATSTGPRVHESLGKRAAGALVVVAFLAGCGESGDAAPAGTTTSRAETTTSQAETTTSLRTATSTELRLGDHRALRIDLPSPDWLAADDTHLYVKLDGGTVERIDPATGAVVATAKIGGRTGVAGSGCSGIGLGFDSVWSCHGTDVVRFSLDPFEEVSRIPAGKATSQGHLATGFDRVWVLQGDGSTLAGTDPETEQVGDPIELPVRGTDLAVGKDRIWIVSALDDAVVAIDPVAGAVVHRIDVNEPIALGVVDDTVWIGGVDGVHLVDHATGTIVSTIPGGTGRVGAMAADGTGVWVRRDAEVRRHDAASGAELESFALDLRGPSPGDMLVAFGAVWTSASEDAALFRIDLP